MFIAPLLAVFLILSASPAAAVSTEAGTAGAVAEQPVGARDPEPASGGQPAGEPGPEPAGQPPSPAPALAPPPGAEVVELRERFSETFATEDPRRMRTELASGPIHFREGGKWQKIDRALRAQGQGGRFGNGGRNDFGLSVARNNQDRQLARLEAKSGQAVAFGLEGARPGAAAPDPQAGGQQMVYRSILPHVDLQLTSLAESVKEILVLRSAKAPTRYVFPLTLEGLTAEVDGDGRVLYLDGERRPVFTTPRPWMADSLLGEDRPGAASDAAAFRVIDQAGGGKALELTISPEWLADPARVFPVKVDPTTAYHHAYAPYFYTDTFYAEGNRSFAYTSDPYLYSGVYAQNTYYKHRSFLQFGLGDKITPGDGQHRVLGARLNVWQIKTSNCQRELYAKRVTQNWHSGPDAYAGQFGPAYDAYDSATLPAENKCPLNGVGWLTTDVTGTAVNWENNTAIDNFGFALLGSLTFSDSERAYISQNHSDSAHHPKLSVDWENSVPELVGSRSPVDGAVLSSSPTSLQAAYRSDDGDWWRARFNLQRRNPDGSWAVVREWEGASHECGTCVTSASIGQTLGVGSYAWTVLATDGSNDSGWAPFSYFTVNRPPNLPTGLSPAAGARLTTTTPTLSATYSDPDGDVGRVYYYVYNSVGAVVAKGMPSGTVASGGRSSWPVPAGALVEGGSYTYRAYGYDQVSFGSPTSAVGFRVNTAPDLPTGLSPANGARLSTETPTLSGIYSDPDGDPGRVRFYVYDAAGALVTNGMAATTVASGSRSSWAVPAGVLVRGKDYTYKARGYDQLEYSGYSTAVGFVVNSVPGVPTGLSPANGARLSTVTPTLSGIYSDPDGDPGRVRFYVYDAAGAMVTNGMAGTTVLSGDRSYWAVPAGVLVRGGSYTYKARGYDLLEYSGDSAAVGFTVNQLSDVPTDLSPAAGARLTTVIPVLSGTYNDADGDQGRIQFQVFDAAGLQVAEGMSPTTVGSGSRSSWTVPSGALTRGDSYTYRARGFDGTEYSAYTATVGFAVNAVPGLPTGLSPAAGARLTTVTPTLSGVYSDADGDQGRVRFYVYDPAGTLIANGMATTTVAHGGRSSWTVPAGVLVRGGSYTYKARGYDGLEYSDYSAATAFSVNRVPGIPDQLSPPNGSRPETLTPTLSGRYLDDDANPGRIRFTVYDATGGTVTRALGSTAAHLGRSSWTVPAGALVDGQVYTWRAEGYDGLEYSAQTGPVGFTVQTDQTPPTEPGALRSTSHVVALNSDDRSLDVTWLAGQDAQSGVAGYDVLFNRSPDDRTSPATRVTTTMSTSPALTDGAWYAHARTADNTGNLSGWVTAGPYLIGEATLAGGLPGPVAQSSETGLEQFGPFEDHDTGNGTSYVQLRTGNLVSSLDLATVPGHGLNTVLRLTHNAAAGNRDAGVGRGWSLSVTDLEAGLDGMLGDASDGTVTDIDVNRDLALADLTGTGELSQEGAYTGAKLSGRVLEFTDGDGTVHRFVRDGAAGGRWSSPPGVDLRVREVLDSQTSLVTAYELVRPDGVTYTATDQRVALGLSVPVWRISEVTDRNNNQLSYTHANFGPTGVNRTRLIEIRHNRTGDSPVVRLEYAPYDAEEVAQGRDDGGVLRAMTTLPGHRSADGRQWERRTTFAITAGGVNAGDGHRLTSVTENTHTAPGGVELAQRTTAFGYEEPSGRLTSISEPVAGASVPTEAKLTRFGYTALAGEQQPRLSGITDRAGKSWSYGYVVRPADGWTLTTATRPVSDGVTSTLSYEIDARGPIGDTDDQRIAGGNLRKITDAGTGEGSELAPVTSAFEWYANKLVQTVDGVGAVSSMTYNDLGLLTSVTQPPPNRSDAPDLPADAPTGPVTSRISYDPPDQNARPTSYPGCTQPTGGDPRVSREMWCQTVAELTRTVFAEGRGDARVSDFGYSPSGDLVSVIERARADGSADPADRNTAFTYFDRGGLRSIDGPRTEVSDVTCYGQAAVAGSTGECAANSDPYGGYDRTGMPAVLRDAAGKTKNFAYTPYGMVVSVTDRDGRTTTSRYDERDNLLAATDPAGRTDAYSWDAADNKLTDVEPSGKTTRYGYDDLDRLFETVAPGERRTTTRFFDDGTVAETNGPRQSGASATFTQYWPNRLVRSVSAPTAAGVGRAETSYRYDTAGRVTSTVLPVADAAGNRPTETVTYTPDGQEQSRAQTAATGPAGNTDRVTRLAYNAHGEAIRTSGPRSQAGATARNDNTYDAFGQLVRSTRLLDAARQIVSESSYDSAGNQTRTTQATGTGAQLVTLYRYDSLNRLAAQLTDPANPGHDVTYAYTGEDQQAERTDWNQTGGDPSASCADADVPCTALRSTSTTFNADNSKRSQLSVDRTKDAGDPTRALSTCNYPAGVDPSTGYDVDGNLLVTRTVRGTGSEQGCAGGTVLREQSFAYTAEDWLASSTQQVRSPQTGAMISRTQAMTYFPDGVPETVTHTDPAAGTNLLTRYTSTDAGWVDTVTDWRGKTSRFDYLPSGDVTGSSLGGVANAASTYHVDGMVSGLTWTGAVGASAGKAVRAHTGIGYDVGGLRTSEQVRVLQPGKTTPEGAQATYTHDLLDRLTGWTSPFPFSPTDATQPATAYALDDGGNTVAETVTVGGAVRSQVDSVFTAGRLERRTTTVRSTTGVVDSTTADTFLYNPLGEETRRASSATVAGVDSPVVSSTDSRYDPLGHPVLADATNPPAAGVITPAAPDADVGYDYDTGDRVLTRTETGNGPTPGPAKHTVFFYWGNGGSLAEETDGAGRTKVRYLLDGDSEALAQQSYTVNPDGTAAATNEKWTWLLNDAVGNTATLLADDGTVVEQKAFDPFGQPEMAGSARSTEPDAPKSTLGFQSTMTDEVTGKVMLGSRQYDPTTARFTTPDTFIAGQLDLELGTDSLTGNRYLFAAANPLVFYEDGHGMFSRLKKLAKRAVPALQYVPVVSSAIDIASAATGRNWYEGGRRMKGGERLAMLAGSALGLVPGGGIAKAGIKGALKGVQKARSVGKPRAATVGGSCRRGSTNSFLPATLVLMADGSSKAISDIAVGDLVWAADPATGEAAARPVTDLIEGTGRKQLVDITVAGDLDGPLSATDGHPVWVEQQGWTDAADLAVGNLLRQTDGDPVAVIALRIYTLDSATVHNLTVADLHTYYVEAGEPVLVHNAKKGKCGGGPGAQGPETPKRDGGDKVRKNKRPERDSAPGHTKKRPSAKEKHEGGDRRRGMDRGREKGDKRRDY